MSEGRHSDFVDYYEVLGVIPAAEVSEIRKKYILQAKEHHPDAGGSTQQMQLLNNAYKTLSNESSRAAYDMVYGYHNGTVARSDFDYTNAYFTRDVTDMTEDEIDDYIDTLFAEYHTASLETKQGLGKWFRSLFAA